MAKNVIYNSDGVLYNDDNKVFIKEGYYPIGTAIRYYPLYSDGKDYGGYESDLEVTGVTFNNGYAEFLDGNGILKDTTLSFGQLSANFTIFCWHKWYSGDPYGKIVYINGTDGYYSIEQPSLNNTISRTWYTPSGNISVEDTTIAPIEYDTWYWSCNIQYFGSYRQYYHGVLNPEDTFGVGYWSGQTVAPNADAHSNINILNIGSVNDNNRYRGGISGLIIASGRWNHTQVITQAKKGPATLYEY